jgi:hypothetical protein
MFSSNKGSMEILFYLGSLYFPIGKHFRGRHIPEHAQFKVIVQEE